MYLHQAGLSVEIANNGQEALNKVNNKEYSVILMDIQMPVMDGLSATKRLREDNYENPIIALTANVLKNERDVYLQAGFDAILTKPIILDDFYSTIQTYVQSKSKINHLSAKNIFSEQPSTDDVFKSLVEQFLFALQQELVDLNAFIKNKDWAHCQKLLHNIKGRGGSFGFPKMTTLSSELETLLKENQFDDFNVQFVIFQDYCLKIISENNE